MRLNGLARERLMPDGRYGDDHGVAVAEEIGVVRITLGAERLGQLLGAGEVHIEDAHQVSARRSGSFLRMVVSENAGACDAHLQPGHSCPDPFVWADMTCTGAPRQPLPSGRS